MEFDDWVVVDYLIKNFEFFICNVCVVEVICVLYLVCGIVLLVEWYMVCVCNYIYVLEENMVLLMEQVIVNEGLFYCLFYLQCSFIVVSSFDDMLMCFYCWVCDFGLVGVSLCLFSDCWCLGVLLNYIYLVLSCQFFELLCIQCLGQEQYYFGLFNGLELLVVLLEVKVVGLVVMLMLGSDVDLGVVLFISCDVSYY